MTARRAARAPRPGAHALADVAVLVAALAVAALPVVPAYAVGAVWPALLGGLAVGAAIAATAARRGWAVLPTLAVLVVAFVVAGGALAAPGTTLGGVVPTGATVRTLLGGVVTVWADVLTRQAPLGADGGTLVAPYTLAVAGAAAAVSVALRARTASRAVLAAAAPPLVGVAALALGTRETLLPMVTGLVAAGGLLTWVAWRLGRLAVRRVVALALTVAVAGAGGVVVGPVLADQRPRYVLRDEVTPPFDPREQPSPLAGYRRFVKDWQDTPLLTVRGLPDGAPVRLATLDAYDGVVWSVGAPGAASGSGAFRRPAGSVDAGAAGAPAPDGRAATVDVEVHALPGVWLPTVGEAAAVRVTGSSAGTSADTSADTSAQADPADGLRVNRTTDTAVLTGGVPDGLTYTLDTTVPPVPDDAAIGAAAPAAVTLPPVTAVPDVVGLVAGEMAGQASTPLEVARALEAGLAERGWFSHGNTDAGDHPSLSGHGADRITSLLSGDLMVGDSEQYASAMALMARELGLPARVVLGFRPDAGAPADGDAGEVVVTGDDAQAWVEIAFAGHGWVPFHPTPDESRTPDERTPQDEAQPEPQVVQPPPPPAEPVAPPEVDAEQPITEDPSGPDAATAGWPRVVAVAAAVVGVPLLLVLAPSRGSRCCGCGVVVGDAPPPTRSPGSSGGGRRCSTPPPTSPCRSPWAPRAGRPPRASPSASGRRAPPR